MVGDDFEPQFTDTALLHEIELLADVMAAAAQVDGRLTIAQLDGALGVAIPEPAAAPEAV
ncbi:hypothetical protein [Phycicoccus sp. Soil803]|uniref:hypothetical protein n=1 Tax=Phycicoccus sp. Soil803 TaxID=1736415 RepID=UPI00070E4D24|nr:hypothetical protein [Phycicoccus sp. Soil803]KRF25023.1 hypothetical protein ASG95_11300 [Phycicoccus sp. Soil803]